MTAGASRVLAELAVALRPPRARSQDRLPRSEFMAKPAGFRFALAAVSAAAAFAFLTGCGGGGSAVAPQPQNQANNPAPNGFPPGTVYITAAETAAKPAYTNFRYHVTAVAQPSGVHTMGVVYSGDMT